MAEQLNKLVAEVTPDNLINSAHTTNACHVTVAAGQGVLKRGTALGIKDDKAVILGTDGATASYILAKDVDATAEAVAVAYREGHFNADALIVKSGYTMTAKDKDDFRTRNIILSESL